MNPLGPLRATLIVAAFVGVPWLAQGFASPYLPSLAWGVLVGAIGQAAVATATPVAFSVARLSLRPDSLAGGARDVGLGVLAGGALSPLLGELGRLVAQVRPLPPGAEARLAEVLHPHGTTDTFAVLLGIACLAPFAEEVVFRGILLPGIARSTNAAVGVLLSSLAFGIAHGQLAYAVVAVCAGVVFGLITLRRGQLLPTLAAHAAHNLTTFVTGAFASGYATHEAKLPWPVATAALVVLASALFGLWRAPQEEGGATRT